METITLNSGSGQVLDDCESSWTLADDDVTFANDTGDFKVGTKSAKMTVAAGFGGNQILSSHKIGTTKDISGDRYVALWVKSSVALAAGDLSLILSPVDATKVGAHISMLSYTENISLQSLEADTWKLCIVPLADAPSDTALNNFAIYSKHSGAHVIHVDQITTALTMDFEVLSVMGADSPESMSSNLTYSDRDLAGNVIEYIGSSNREITIDFGVVKTAAERVFLFVWYKSQNRTIVYSGETISVAFKDPSALIAEWRQGIKILKSYRFELIEKTASVAGPASLFNY